MEKNNAKKILVVFGGVSSERDISVITGVLTLNCIDRQKYIPVPLYVTDNACFTGDKLFDLSFYKSRDLRDLDEAVLKVGSNELWISKRGKLKSAGEIYCAVNCCHGLNGEDGSVFGLLRLCGIPCASPDMLASSVYMDKCASKIYLSGIGVKTVPYKTVTKAQYFADMEGVVSEVQKFGFPLIVKPARLGSSIGIKLAENREKTFGAIEFALRYDGKIIIEKALQNFKEINCAAYSANGKIITSECERPVSAGKFLSFEDKYEGGAKHAASSIFPADIDKEVSDEIKRITENVYRKTFVHGVIRIDYLLCDGEIYLNEVNTVPGSLAMYLFKDKTSDFKDMINELIDEGVRVHRDYVNGTFNHPADVFGNISSKLKGANRSTDKK